MTTSQEKVVKVLDTANPTASPSDTGPEQNVGFGFLKEDKPLRVSVNIAAGDTVVFETKSLTGNDFVTIKTFTSDAVADIYPSLIYRMRRTVDGTVGDSQAWVENRGYQQMSEDGVI